MKKILFIVMLFIGFSAFSQKQKSLEDKLKRFVTHMTKKLDLTADQGSKLRTFVLPYMTKTTEILNKGKVPTVEDMLKDNEEQKNFLKQILTEKQFEKYSVEIHPVLIESSKRLGAK